MVSVGEVNAPQNIHSGGDVGAGNPVGSFGWFATQILQGIGAPINAKNFAFLTAWMQLEHGGGGGANNPLNTTENWAGATNYNSIGVKNFATPQDGVQALIQNLKGGRYNQIVTALQAGDPAGAFNAVDEWTAFVAGPNAPPSRGQDYVNKITSIYNKNLGNPAGAGMQSASGGGTATRTSGGGDTNAYLQSQYGFLWNDPQVGPLLRAANADPNYSMDVFDEQLHATDWWKTHGAAARTWLQQQYSDPATYNQQFGVALAQTNAMAANYGIKTDSAAAQQYVHNLTMNYDPKAIQQNFVTQAKALYPHLSAQLDQGLTLRDIAQPYLTQASNLLERPADSFSLTDPKFTVPLAVHDGKDTRQMTTTEWATALMSNPAYGWDKTGNARDAAVNLTSNLAQSFGVAS